MSNAQPSPARRLFLKWATAVSGLAVAVLTVGPALRAFLSPANRPPRPKRWVKLGEVDLLEIGTPTRVDFTETVSDAWVENRLQRGVWIYSEDGQAFRVYNGRCTHLGCSYAWDEQTDAAFHPEANVFHCPCHHAVYRVTGEVIRGPAPRALDELETKIEEGVLYAAYQDFVAGIPEKIAV